MTKDEALEEVANIVDTLDNLDSAMKLPLQDAHHVNGMKSAIPIVIGRLKQAYFEMGGKDVWSV